MELFSCSSSSSSLPFASSVVLILLVTSSVWPPLADARASITHLPGFDGPLPFELETGYIAVGEVEDSHMFYYYIKSERNPSEDPLMFWLTGGPACSALSGLLFEIGPLTIDIVGYDEGLPKLIYREHSWTKIANIIFVDSPIGTGFSYSRIQNGYKTGDLKTVRQVYTFIEKWYADHPEFLSNPLYMAGDSYSGKVLPAIVKEIADGNDAGEGSLFNLKGYLLGNPVTDKNFDVNAVIPYFHGMGLVSDELYESTKESCHGEYFVPPNAVCARYIDAVDECTSGIYSNYILEPLCEEASPKLQDVILYTRLERHDGQLQLPNSLLPFECRSYGYMLSSFWANNDTVREALNIHKGSINSWKRCNKQLDYTGEIVSSIAYHLHLTTRGYPALIYSGDHDAYIPHVGTQNWIKSLNFSIVEDWRPWMVDGQVGGFTRKFANNLTFATVKGGGHTAPEYRPKECLAMVQRWISGESL